MPDFCIKDDSQMLNYAVFLAGHSLGSDQEVQEVQGWQQG